MKKQKKTVEQEINEFLEHWDQRAMSDFLYDILPLFELYDVDDENDWVSQTLNGDEEETRTVRLIRTVYLISRIAEFHAGKLCSIKTYFKDLHVRMEKEGTVEVVQ
jgi:hypothetical protein